MLDERSPRVDPTGLRYRATLDSLIEGFQILGFDWTYLYINPSAAAHGKSTVAALAGRTLLECYPGIEQSAIFAIMQRCMDERSGTSVENLFTYADGEARWFELRIHPVPEGLCVQSVDIHERKLAETALREANERLETKVAERTAALEELRRELEAFTYTVSHDLRAPVRHIKGFTELLGQNAGDALTPTARRHLATISKAADRMGLLIDGLLAFSRTSRIPVGSQRVSLAETVRQARMELADKTAGRDIVWSIGELHDVDADPALLRIVIVNLLSNAIKFTRTNRTAHVDVSSSIDSGTGQVVVCVRDDGVGFNPDYGHKLFGVFQRLHREEEFEGIGIGLANVRRIVHRHGGRVWAEGKTDEGATFQVSLPRAQDRSAPRT